MGPRPGLLPSPPYHVLVLVPTNNAPGLDSRHFVSVSAGAGCVSVLLLILTLEVRTISTEVRYLSLSRCCVTTSHHRIGVLRLVSVLLLILNPIVEK